MVEYFLGMELVVVPCNFPNQLCFILHASKDSDRKLEAKTMKEG
jgi:hypothetical protein